MIIYYNNGTGFGDLWSVVHFLLRKSEANKDVVHISRFMNEHYVKPTLESMLTLIDVPPAARLVISDERANASTNLDSWTVKYYPTKSTWKPPIIKAIAYQFDGRSSAHLKNPSQKDIDAFMEWAQRRGIPLIRIGLPLTMEQSARALAEDATCFVGCCSGMSTLAVSVGIPTYVLEYDLKVAWWYGPNSITVCPGMQSFIHKYEALYG